MADSMATDDERAEKTRWVRLLVRDPIARHWVEFSDARLVVALGTTAGLGLVTFYHDDWTLALGVPRHQHDVYLPMGPPDDGQCHPDCRKGTSTHCFCGWIWGGATEAYQMCLDYFGLGPALLACWPPDSGVPRPVRLAGKACRLAADLLDDALTWAEGHLPGTAGNRLDDWLSVAGVGRLSRQARALDPSDCGHPACVGHDCIFSNDKEG